jgi:hypothetical protein
LAQSLSIALARGAFQYAAQARGSKMAKHVFRSHAEVAHIWANNDDPAHHGRVSGRNRVFFHGMTIFSYGRHYPIASKVAIGKRAAKLYADHDMIAQKYVVLFNAAGSTVSTAKHRSEARRASRQFLQFFVPFCGEIFGRSQKEVDAGNLEYLVKQAREEAERQTRQTQYSAEYARARVRDLCRDALDYAYAFGLRAPKLDPIAMSAEIESVHDKRKAEREKKIAAWEKRSAKIAEEYRAGSFDAALVVARAPRFIAERIEAEQGEEHTKNLRAWLLTNHADMVARFSAGVDDLPRDPQSHFLRRSKAERDNVPRDVKLANAIRSAFAAEYNASVRERLLKDYPESIARFRAGEHIREIWANADEYSGDALEVARLWREDHELAREAANIAKWRAGERAYFGYNLPIMLRVSGEDIETSRGARFPIEHARRALPLLLRARSRLNAETLPRMILKREASALGMSGDDMGRTIRLGAFSVDAIDSAGVTAGCHFVTWQEVCSAAQLIGMEC